MVIVMVYLDLGDIVVEGECYLYLLLVKVDSCSGRLFECYDSDFEEDVFVVVGSDSFWLDIVCYCLSLMVCVFGVVFYSVVCGVSCLDVGFDNLLILVVLVGEGKLWLVFNIYLDQWRMLKGLVCFVEFGFEQEVLYLILEFGCGCFNGFVDLVIILWVSDGEMENGKFLCMVKCMLCYDGECYLLEEYLDFWYCQ